ncbi:helix-turn-helix transcriptional regulator [Micromonospora sp. NPDC049559]|uniref:helix-turn-helix domain-containing protein n=1 Tax=Micromonospora sp. NPDC049559 TaxID=3155923 RepID=UPI0034336E9C
MKYIRGTKGLSQEQVGEGVHVSASLIGMFETGRRIPQPDTARQLDEVFGTGDLFAKLSFQERREGQPVWFRPWPEVEAEARSLRWHESNVIPGLIQTEAYARAVLNSGLLRPDEAEEQVAIRLARRAAVFDRDEPPICTFVIDEAVLRRGEPAVLKQQLLDLVEMGERSGVFIHVIPATAGLHLGLAGPFVLAGLPGGETVGYVDDQLLGRITSDAELVAALERAWQAVCAVALPCDQSRDLILKVANDL